MAIYKTIKVNPDTNVLIWRLEESLEELSAGIALPYSCEERLALLKSELHRRQFLSIRHLIKAAGFDENDLYYDELGKPHLNAEEYISITHSFGFTAVIIGRRPVGIDIEKNRDKILRIANKFTPLEEYNTLANTEAIIRKLTIVWSAKEAVYKILNEPGVSFLNHINVEDFDFEDEKTKVEVNYKNKKSVFTANFHEFEQFSCVYALYSKPDF